MKPEVLRARLRTAVSIGLMFALVVVLGIACATVGALLLVCVDRAGEVGRRIEALRRETDRIERETHCASGAALYRDGYIRWCQR